MHQYIERVVDLLDPASNQIYNMSVDEARERILNGTPASVRQIDGSFALIAREGKKVRGSRIEATENGHPLVQEVYTWEPTKGGEAFVVMFDDSPARKGDRSPDATRFRALIEKTLKYDAPSPSN